jgi:hypothetical protein
MLYYRILDTPYFRLHTNFLLPSLQEKSIFIILEIIIILIHFYVIKGE